MSLRVWVRVQASGHDQQRGTRNDGTDRNDVVVLQEDDRVDHEYQSQLEDKVDDEGNRLVTQLWEIFDAYHTTCFKASDLSQAAVSVKQSHRHPNERDKKVPPAGVLYEPSLSVGPSDPAGAVEIWRSFGHNQLLEAILKTGSTIH